MLHKGFRIGEYMPTALLLGLFLDRDQPQEKRYAACLSLGEKPDDQAFEALRHGLLEDDWRIRLFSLEAIKNHPRAEEAEDAIVALLFDADDQVSQTACKIVGERRIRAAHDPLLHLIETATPEIRDIALSTLPKIWEEGDFERVLEVFRTEEKRGVRIAAAKTLRKQATPRTWRRLFQLWRRDREVRHRLWCCELAGEYGSEAERPVLRDMLEDRNRNVRIAAEKALRRLNAA